MEINVPIFKIKKVESEILNTANVHINLGQFLSFTNATDYFSKCCSGPCHVLGTVLGFGVRGLSARYNEAQFLDLTCILRWQMGQVWWTWTV